MRAWGAIRSSGVKAACALSPWAPHDTPFASKIDGHLPQSRGLFWNVFCKTGRSHNRKPFEYVRAGFAAHFDICFNVSRSYFRFGMPYQYIRTAHVGGGYATRSVKPVDQRRAAPRPQYVEWVKIAVAKTFALGGGLATSPTSGFALPHPDRSPVEC